MNAAAMYLATLRDPADVLDVIDAILATGGPWPRKWPGDGSGAMWRHDRAMMVRELAVILEQGSSAYRINDDINGLVRRVDATVTAAATASITAAEATSRLGSASDQLRSAWAKLYGLKPDPPVAYREAIQAVESAAHAIVEPNNARATLGTMLGQLRSTPGQYELAIPGPDQTGSVEPLIKMMELLWAGQTSRHGAQTVTRAETAEETAMAVHLAVLLVYWFATGAVRRKR